MVQKLALIKYRVMQLCYIHYINVVLIGMIEITLRECRFGGSKNALIVNRILYLIISLGLRRNYATRVSVRSIILSLIMTLTDYNITK